MMTGSECETSRIGTFIICNVLPRWHRFPEPGPQITIPAVIVLTAEAASFAVLPATMRPRGEADASLVEMYATDATGILPKVSGTISGSALAGTVWTIASATSWQGKFTDATLVQQTYVLTPMRICERMGNPNAH